MSHGDPNQMSKKHRGGRPSRSTTPSQRPSATPGAGTRATPASPPSRSNRTLLIAAGLGVVAIVAAGALMLGGSGGSGGGTAAATPTARASGAIVAAAPLPADIDPAAAAARWESGAVLLDVREPSEWNAGHVPGAEHIPLGELAARVDELPADAEILVICRSGNRSQQGRDILVAAGLEQVTSVNGGVRAWREAGLPYEGDIA